MPKRPCPFEETSFCPQQKVFVNVKHVNRGVMSNEKMKAVYDKTLSLLYSGAKNFYNNNTAEQMDDKEATSSTSHIEDKSHLHQMVLTSQGSLAKPIPITERLTAQQQGSGMCGDCKTIAIIRQPPCAYCECYLCDSCARSCFICKGDFCKKCSLIMYLQEERVVCLSCC